MRGLVLFVVGVAVGCGGARKTAAEPAQKPVEVAKPDAEDGADESGCEEPNAAEPVSVKPPVGYLEMTVAGVVGTEGGNAVVLVDPARTLGIPVFIGGTEAMAIQLRLENRKYQRPLTHDLLDAIVAKLGGRIVAVRVDSIENDVFIGTVLVQRGKRIVEIDSRVSDALALAIGNRVPIYVAKRVLDKSGVDVQKLGLPPGETARLEAR